MSKAEFFECQAFRPVNRPKEYRCEFTLFEGTFIGYGTTKLDSLRNALESRMLQK